MAQRRRNGFMVGVFVTLLATLAAMGAVRISLEGPPSTHRPIRIGLLIARTGPLAVADRNVEKAQRLAIQEINATGGLLNRPLEPIVVDTESDSAVALAGAQRLLEREKVPALFGCATSGCRKSLRPLVEAADSVLVYPYPTEGMEESPNILSLGAAPNQQIIPVIKWSMDTFGRRIFFIGSDGVNARIAAQLTRLQITALRGQMVGEEYMTADTRDFGLITARIQAARPDVIFNFGTGTINGAFMVALRGAGIMSTHTPVMSFALGEDDIRAIGPLIVSGDYVVQSYFGSIGTAESQGFKERLRAAFGLDVPATAAMEAAYIGIHLWARAVQDAQSIAWKDMRPVLGGLSFNAPGGVISVDPVTFYAWKTVRIGMIADDGEIDITWESGRPVRPVPFPGLKSADEWQRSVDLLYTAWGRRWEPPRSDTRNGQ
jgi:urea transport system substrate-binding protein